jgi:hypothetical protein
MPSVSWLEHMGYTLQALIGNVQIIQDHIPTEAIAILLDQGFAMIPLTEDVSKQFGLEFLSLVDAGHMDLPPRFLDFCCDLSKAGKLAYVEAEFFGGVGTQACVLFDQGVKSGSFTISPRAINEGLRALGVQRLMGKDEFESVGLDRERDTKDWVRSNAS